jgi:hypothetical protein
MIALFVWVLTLVLLVFCWAVGDQEFRTKVIFTLVYLATWGLVFANPWFLISAQALLSVILWYSTFGPVGRR